jgi:hypothetical protein
VTAKKRSWDAGAEGGVSEGHGEGLCIPPDSVEVSFDPAAPPSLKNNGGNRDGNRDVRRKWFVEIVTLEEVGW